jgi:hypothetical protein
MSETDKPALEPYTADTLAEFRRAGINPTDEEIVRLNDAARLYSMAARDVSAKGVPVLVGDESAGAWLWPTTIQADRWYALALRWFDGDDALQTVSLGFAMAHARESGIFDYLMASAERSRAAVEEWANCLAVTYAELLAGISSVIDQARLVVPTGRKTDEPKSGKGNSFSSLVAILSDRTGIPPEHWESHVSRDYLLHHVQSLCAQQSAEGGKLSEHDPMIEAERAVGWVEMQIKEAHAALALKA